MSTPTYYHCGICDQYHDVHWLGDCREDDARFNSEDLDDKHGAFGWDEIDMDDVDMFLENEREMRIRITYGVEA